MTNYKSQHLKNLNTTQFIANVNKWLTVIYNWILDFVFPKKCVGCKIDGSFLCSACEGKIEYLTTQVCLVCQKPSVKGFTHPNCATIYTPERLYSPFVYKGVIRNAILETKYSGAFAVLDPLLNIFVEAVLESALEIGDKAIVIPIPLHRSRYTKRGFNQAEYIASKIADAFNVPCHTNILQRIVNTKSQVGLDKEARRENVKNAFGINPKTSSILKDSDIVLVDDVGTSGATMLSASKALKRAGCRYIYCLCLAKD